MNSCASSQRRVAILGGGLASLTAAWELAKVRSPDGGKKYCITVYQSGWRLGGKGASGRNVERHNRIEEHGLHVWFGAYANSFRFIRDIYAHQRGKWPNGRLLDAFIPQYGFRLMERRHGAWSPWPFPLPRGRIEPGAAKPVGDCTPMGLGRRVRHWVADYFNRSLSPFLVTAELNAAAGSGTERLAPLTAATLRHLAETDFPDDPTTGKSLADQYAAFADRLWQQVTIELASPAAAAAKPGWDEDTFRRAGIIVMITLAVITGQLRDIGRAGDWDDINDKDLRSWVRSHLGRWAKLADSELVTAIYDLYFSYADGDSGKGGLEAGTAVRAAIWLLLEYKGAFMWRMASGMGDTIFTPLYNALRDEGVAFKFFHKVTRLHLSKDRKQIAGISVLPQARFRNQHAGYEPFVRDSKGCECWPDRPNFDQLAEGEDLKAGWEEFDLESDCSTWKSRHAEVRLKRGEDFDDIVLGIPLASLRSICQELVRANDRFRTMLDTVQTVATQALQLWIRQSARGLQPGLRARDEALILTTFENPLDTYADMSHVKEFESWPDADVPEHIAYFCGVLPEAKIGAMPEEDGYRAKAFALVNETAKRLLTAQGARKSASIAAIWPAAIVHGGQDFDWSLLCGSNAAGQGRLDDQFWRANVDLSERYVLALPGTSKHRLAAHQSGYGNLFLAGDWISNGLFLGCVEGAVISGMQAARALSSRSDMKIVGEDTLFRKPQ